MRILSTSVPLCLANVTMLVRSSSWNYFKPAKTFCIFLVANIQSTMAIGLFLLRAGAPMGQYTLQSSIVSTHERTLPPSIRIPPIVTFSDQIPKARLGTAYWKNVGMTERRAMKPSSEPLPSFSRRHSPKPSLRTSTGRFRSG